MGETRGESRRDERKGRDEMKGSGKCLGEGEEELRGPHGGDDENRKGL